jgi:uncharacterized membrane protein YbhN (UPF0104 family)
VKRYVRIAIAVIVIAVVVWYVRQIDWNALGRATADANIALLVLAVLGNAPLVWLKAVRLRLLVGKPIGILRLMGFYVASYAADNLMMSQAGLGVRVALLHREGLPLASAVAVQGLEKLLEGVGLALCALPLLFVGHLEPWLESALHWCLGVGAAATIVLVVLVALSSREIRALRALKQTLLPLRDRRIAPAVTALTLAAWAVEVGMVLATLAALHQPAEISTAMVVLVAVNVAALVPGLPANLGSFELAATIALRSFGITDEAALAFAIIHHAAHTIPVTVIGLFAGQNALQAKAGPVGN